MSLIIPYSGFSQCTSSVATTSPSPTGEGAQINSSAVANTKGNVVSLIDSLAHDVHYLVVYADGTFAATTNVSTLLDIMINPNGLPSSPDAWAATLIPNLLIGYRQKQASDTNWLSSGYCYHFPIFIPMGTAIGGRTQSASAIDARPRIAVWAYGEPTRPDEWWCGQGVETLGVSTGSSRGTSVPTNTVSANTFGNWKMIGTITRRSGCLQFGYQGDGSTGLQAHGHQINFGTGDASPDKVTQIGPALWGMTSINEFIHGLQPSMPYMVDLDPGTNLWCRHSASSTSSDSLDFAIYSVY